MIISLNHTGETLVRIGCDAQRFRHFAFLHADKKNESRRAIPGHGQHCEACAGQAHRREGRGRSRVPLLEAQHQDCQLGRGAQEDTSDWNQILRTRYESTEHAPAKRPGSGSR